MLLDNCVLDKSRSKSDRTMPIIIIQNYDIFNYIPVQLYGKLSIHRNDSADVMRLWRNKKPGFSPVVTGENPGFGWKNCQRAAVPVKETITYPG